MKFYFKLGFFLLVTFCLVPAGTASDAAPKRFRISFYADKDATEAQSALQSSVIYLFVLKCKQIKSAG